jgi:fermentation-respiration switch protein FrsA (DUF1100 family)
VWKRHLLAITGTRNPIAFTIKKNGNYSRTSTSLYLLYINKFIMSPRSVQFDSQGLKLAGLLWVPANTDTKKHAAIVIGHPMGAVKEQTPSVYAEHLNKLGFVTLVFDAAYQGESEGLPRYLEDPSHRVEDIKNAVSYLTTLEQVDSDRIGLIGICASGGYATTAAQTDVRIKALATISSVDSGSLIRDGFLNTNTAEQLQKGLAEAAQDRTNEANGQAPRVVPIMPTAEIAATLPDKSMFKEYYDYYGTLVPSTAEPLAFILPEVWTSW